MYKLKFKDHIAATATKPIGVSDLLKSLKKLSSELQALDQENLDRDSLLEVATSLASPNLLSHKNKGIVAYALCCIADLLRVCAPDAPFSQAQLKGFFECFARQLKNLGDIDGPYYQQHYYVLDSLASIESIVLLGDIEKGEDIILDIFRNFFDIAANDQGRQNATEHMVSIMKQLVDESPQLSSELLEILLAQLLRPSKSGHTGNKSSDAAYSMSQAVFSGCADRLQRDVCQYFTDILFDARQGQSDGEEVEMHDEQLKVAHDLVYELFTCAPTTLQNVIPQLESELNVENTLCRRLATKTISVMLASSNGGIILQQYTSAYNAWVCRRNDKSVIIRALWVEGIGQVLSSSNGAVRMSEVETLCMDGILTRLVDPDEKVRAAACHVIEHLDYKTAKARLTADVLKTYADRCRDRKPAAHKAAFGHIGKLFSTAYSDITNGDQQAIEKFAPLVNYILNCIYVNDMGINVLVERTLHDDLLNSAELDDKARTERMLMVLKLTDDKARHAFFAIVGQWQKVAAQSLDGFLLCCDKYNGGIMDNNKNSITDRLTTFIKLLAQRFPDSALAETNLFTFAKNNDRRSYKLVRECISPDSNFRMVRKMIHESTKRASQISSQVAETMRIILYRSSFQCYNRSIVTPLSVLSHEEPSKFAEPAELVLQQISLVHPELYMAHIKPLAADLQENPLSVPLSTLKALAHFARVYPAELPVTNTFVDGMRTILEEGQPDQAKQIITILCCREEKPAFLQPLLRAIVDNLTYGTEKFLTHLAIIAQINLVAPDLLEDRANEITAFCAKELLMKNRQLKLENDAEEWLEDSLVPDECTAKCYAIRILGNRLRGYHAEDTAIDLARPVFKALRSIILNMGELSIEEETPLAFRSRLRLEVGKMVLKLAAFPVYEQMITSEDFIQVALFAQDFEVCVRKEFLLRLQKSLIAKKLTPRWYTIMFLAAYDPEDVIRDEIKRRIVLQASQQGMQRCSASHPLESIMPRLIHLLAHHPDFLSADRDEDDIINFSTYFSFYFDTVATADNLVVIYHYCQRVKQVTDALIQDETNSENIFILSDVAQVVVSAKAAQHGWPLLVYPKKLKLPLELYTAHTSSSVVKENQSRVFLTEEQQNQIRLRVVKNSRLQRVPKARVEVTRNSTPKKRQLNGSTTGGKKRSKLDTNGTVPSSTERRSSSRLKKLVVYKNSDSDGSSSEDSVEISDSSEN